MDWLSNQTYGIFLHWGIYSVPGFADYRKSYENKLAENGSEWYWQRQQQPRGNPGTRLFHAENYPNMKYQDFANMFTAPNYDPKMWASIFKQLGASYVVITTKHHDGFCLFDTPTDTHMDYGRHWCAPKCAAKRDLIAPFVQAMREEGLIVCFYYSLLEWKSKQYRVAKRDNNNTRYLYNVVYPQLQYLYDTYKPTHMWFDGDWGLPYTYWNLPKWMAEHMPDTTYNDRVGKGAQGQLGHIYNYDDGCTTAHSSHLWECAIPLCRGWAASRTHTPESRKSVSQLIEVTRVVESQGGKMLIGIGPLPDGSLDYHDVMRLHEYNQCRRASGFK